MRSLLFFACLSSVSALSFNETMEYSVKNSPDLAISLQKRDIAKAELSKAFADYFPQIVLKGDFSSQNFNQTDGAPPNDSNDYWHTDYDIEVNQNIFDGLSRFNRVRQQKNELRSQQYVYQNGVEELALDLAKLSFEIQHALRVIDMAKDNFNKINQIKDLIAKRVKEGVSKDIELVQAQGRLSVAKTNILESVRNLRELKAQFTQLTGGLPADQLISPTLKALPFSSFDELWLHIQQHGHSLRPYHALQKSSLYSYHAQKGHFLPTVDIYGKYKYDKGLTNNPNTTQRTRNLGIRAQWNIFEAGKQGFETYIHAQRYQQARLEVKKQQHAILAKAQMSWESYNVLSDAMEFFKRHTQSSLKTTKSYYDQFIIGQKTLLDLLDAYNELLRAQKTEDYNQMLLEHNKLELSQLGGNLLKDLDLQVVPGVILDEQQIDKLTSSFGIIDRNG